MEATELGDALGYARGMRVWFHNMPDAIRTAVDPDRLGLEEQPSASDGLNAAHLFCRERQRLSRELAALAELLQTNGFIWVSWPADEASELDEAAVRAVAADLRLDVTQQCALPGWASLKLMRDRAPR